MVTTQIREGTQGGQNIVEEGAWRSLSWVEGGLRPTSGFSPNIQDDLGSLTFLKCKIEGTGLVYQAADRTLFSVFHDHLSMY